MIPINNRLEEDEADITGVDNAISVLSLGGSGPDEHPERRQKVIIQYYIGF
jgi:hypothetical protein